MTYAPRWMLAAALAALVAHVQAVHAQWRPEKAIRIVGAPEFRKFIFDSGLDYGGMPPAEFAAKVKSDYERWGRVIRDANVKLD